MQYNLRAEREEQGERIGETKASPDAAADGGAVAELHANDVTDTFGNTIAKVSGETGMGFNLAQRDHGTQRKVFVLFGDLIETQFRKINRGGHHTATHLEPAAAAEHSALGFLVEFICLVQAGRDHIILRREHICSFRDCCNTDGWAGCLTAKKPPFASFSLSKPRARPILIIYIKLYHSRRLNAMHIFDGKHRKTLSIPVNSRCPAKNTPLALCTISPLTCIIKLYDENYTTRRRTVLKSNLHSKLYRLVGGLEVIVGICILVAVAAAIFGLIADIHIPTIVSSPESLQAYLTTAMTIIIGVEFVKMIFSYNINTVIEVLMLAVARQMVVTHTSPVENLITIVSVSLLFAIRKFLYVPQLDQNKHDTHGSLLPHFMRRALHLDEQKEPEADLGKEESSTHVTQ